MRCLACDSSSPQASIATHHAGPVTLCATTIRRDTRPRLKVHVACWDCREQTRASCARHIWALTFASECHARHSVPVLKTARHKSRHWTCGAYRFFQLHASGLQLGPRRIRRTVTTHYAFAITLPRLGERADHHFAACSRSGFELRAKVTFLRPTAGPYREYKALLYHKLAYSTLRLYLTVACRTTDCDVRSVDLGFGDCESPQDPVRGAAPCLWRRSSRRTSTGLVDRGSEEVSRRHRRQLIARNLPRTSEVPDVDGLTNAVVASGAGNIRRLQSHHSTKR